jgi:hypothetical protein
MEFSLFFVSFYLLVQIFYTKTASEHQNTKSCKTIYFKTLCFPNRWQISTPVSLSYLLEKKPRHNFPLLSWSDVRWWGCFFNYWSILMMWRTDVVTKLCLFTVRDLGRWQITANFTLLAPTGTGVSSDGGLAWNSPNSDSLLILWLHIKNLVFFLIIHTKMLWNFVHLLSMCYMWSGKRTIRATVIDAP